ncbi:polysaccharide biosynthesis tyrosine autokinase [Xenophilus sp. Marseille-Q4582]|uniref:polysaccharide biosynthesis tyrosine autokinase n=1 Tax=Xenophilus sp. Marseille-Q4582 TaxID=2866600 RepID=UPI001CE42ACD|nr:polysaccharide biosynthesis tyrosine autokinase [Xenophilus sp. Marseille-Q4582]
MTFTAHPAAPAGHSPSHAPDEEVRLSEYVDILLDHKWWVAATTAVALLAGGAYTLLATPVYQSNVLVQVEDAAPDAKGFLGEASSLFDVKTPAAGEIQVLRSRMVVGAAVDQTRFYIDARPRRVPLVGEWLARDAKELSQPGLLGLGGYVSGNERIQVSRLDVPAELEDAEAFTLTAQEDGRYTLSHPLLDGVLEGRVGRLLTHATPHGPLALQVEQLDGLPGAQFTVARASRLRAIETLQQRLQLSEQGRQSNVISVTLEDDDPVRLAGLLNAVGEQYVRQNVERKAAEAQKTLAFLEEQLPEFRQQLEASEEAYTRFRHRNGTVAFDEEAKGLLNQTIELQTRLLEAQQQRRELAARFTDQNVRVRTVDRQIGALRQEIEGLNQRVGRMPTIQQDALRLERDVRVNSELYQSLQNNALQLRLVKEGKIGNVRLLDPAVQPRRAVKPQQPLVLAAALALGLLGGIGVAVLRARLQRGVHDPMEIEAHTGLSVYATVPYAPEQKPLDQRASQGASDVQLLAQRQPDSQPVEALRSLRVALQFAMMDAANNRVLITGPTPDIGKSFVSGNFAAILAQAGKRVLLVDADLRRGHLHKALGLRREGGLSELLAAQLTPEQAIHADVLPGLDVMTTGKLPPNPADLVLSPAFGRTLEQLSGGYDLVLIDSPPVLVASDTVTMAPHCAVMLLVARAGQTQLGEVTECTRRLSQAGCAPNGVVFNGMDLSRRHYGSHAYRYGGYRHTDYRYNA